jgi:carbamoyl-phosphate synthase large subunit
MTMTMAHSDRGFNILITAASRRVPLVREFRRALDASGLGGRVLVTDVNALSPAVQVAHTAYRVPLSTDPSYLPAIESLVVAEGIKLIVPTIDDELPLFGAARGRFARLGAAVIVSSEQTTRLCNDKLGTCEYLRSRGIAAAASFLPRDLPPQPPFPLFIKPRFGRGSVGAFSIRTERELEFFLDYVGDPVVQEYLDGPEFTIDVLCDAEGRAVAVVPRERVVIRAGVIDRGRTSGDRALIDLALECVEAIPFVGPLNIQCRVVSGRPTVFEINPRFSGGIPLTIAAGADFAAMVIDLARGRRLTPAIGRFATNLWMTNYEASFFVAESSVESMLRAVPPGPGRNHGAQ